MSEQLYYENVEVGAEIPQLIKHITTQQLVKWAGAAGDYYQIHYDKDFALSQGLPGVIVQGKLKYAFLTQMLTDWIGERGMLKRLGVSYRGMDFPGEDLICKGKVTNKYVKDNKHYVECEVWTENPKGERTTPGTAVVILPSKGG
jgi:acyl dehydratase